MRLHQGIHQGAELALKQAHREELLLRHVHSSPRILGHTLHQLLVALSIYSIAQFFLPTLLLPLIVYQQVIQDVSVAELADVLPLLILPDQASHSRLPRHIVSQEEGGQEVDEEKVGPPEVECLLHLSALALPPAI